MKRYALLFVLGLLPAVIYGQEAFHRAEQDRDQLLATRSGVASVPHLARLHRDARGTEVGAQLRA